MATQVAPDPAGTRRGDGPDITHLVCLCQIDQTPRLALCGADCTDQQERLTPVEDWCVVCEDLALVAMFVGCERCR